MTVISGLRHFWRARPKLILAALAGVIGFLLSPAHFSLLTRGMISWNILAWFYLVSVADAACRSGAHPPDRPPAG